jgi:hypothetical protein
VAQLERFGDSVGLQRPLAPISILPETHPSSNWQHVAPRPEGPALGATGDCKVTVRMLHLNTAAGMLAPSGHGASSTLMGQLMHPSVEAHVYPMSVILGGGGVHPQWGGAGQSDLGPSLLASPPPPPR